MPEKEPKRVGIELEDNQMTDPEHLKKGRGGLPGERKTPKKYPEGLPQER